MNRLYKLLLNMGIRPEQSLMDKRRIKTINLLNAVVLFFLLIGISSYLFMGSSYPVLAEVFFMALALISMACSYLGKTNAAFLIFTCNANLSLFFIIQYYPQDSACYLFYFPVIVSIILLNNITARNWMAFTHLGISALFFVLAFTIDIESWKLQGLSPEAVRIMLYYNLIMSVLLTAAVSGILNRLIVLQNREIMNQNEDLSRAKEEIKASLKEKEVLLAELNHRVKNNLAIISGLLNLQLETTGNNETKQVIHDSKNRILSMALVHKMLYNHPQLEEIDLANYSRELIRELLNSFNLLQKVEVKENYEKICMPVHKSIPFGLILNEIVTNSIKYVFRKEEGAIHTFEVSIFRSDSEVVLVAKDSGTGFPQDFNVGQDGNSLGLFLIKSLAEQIDGSVQFSNENGARVEFRFSPN